MGKKTNPNKIPRTQADVDKAYQKGLYEGRRDFMDVMIYTIGCDCDMSDEWLDFFNERFTKNMKCHLFGELSTEDMRKTMYAEKNWEIEEV